MLGVPLVLMGLPHKHLFLALLLGCCFSGVEACVERQGLLLPSQLPLEALDHAQLCPAAVQLLSFLSCESFCSLCCWSLHCSGELLDNPLRHPAHTRCPSSCPESLPASLSPETFPGSPGHRQRRSGARRTCAARGPVGCADPSKH